MPRDSLINSHQYGNGSAIFTADGDSARQFTQDVQAGMVGVNIPHLCQWRSTALAVGKPLFSASQCVRHRRRAFHTRYETITTRWAGQLVRSQAHLISQPYNNEYISFLSV